MREIIFTRLFRRDYKRLLRSGRYDIAELEAVISLLARDIPLNVSCREHALTGDWSGCAEYHIRPDWLLIYSREEGTLTLYRSGSHAELFD